MGSWQAIAALSIFVGTIGIIISEWLPLTIAAMLGALLLVILNILTLERAIGYIANSRTTLALFFGVMVMIRVLRPTQIFEYLATQMVLLAKGKGNRLLLGIVAITTPISAVLPNATTGSTRLNMWVKRSPNRLLIVFLRVLNAHSFSRVVPLR